MTITPEQVKQLKEQLSEQIKHLPQDQRAAAQEQIDNMSPEAIESMLNQQRAEQKPIFRAIIAGDVSSKKVEENQDYLAVLDIKPISKGHIIIIQKKAVADKQAPSKSLQTFIKKLVKRIAAKLKPKTVEIISEFKFGETVTNIIPIYDEQLTLASKRHDAQESDLAQLQKLLEEKQKPKVVNLTPKKKKSEIIRLSRRIP